MLLLRGNDHAQQDDLRAPGRSAGTEKRRASSFLRRSARIGSSPPRPRPISASFPTCRPSSISATAVQTSFRKYMQAGLPIMAGNTAYVSRILAESGAGLCYDPADPESIATTVRRLVEDEDLRRRCRQNAAAACPQTFHWQAHSKPLYDSYRRLAGSMEESRVVSTGTVAQRGSAMTHQIAVPCGGSSLHSTTPYGSQAASESVHKESATCAGLRGCLTSRAAG